MDSLEPSGCSCTQELTYTRACSNLLSDTGWGEGSLTCRQVTGLSNFFGLNSYQSGPSYEEVRENPGDIFPSFACYTHPYLGPPGLLGPKLPLGAELGFGIDSKVSWSETDGYQISDTSFGACFRFLTGQTWIICQLSISADNF